MTMPSTLSTKQQPQQTQQDKADKFEIPSWLAEICRKLSKHSNDRKLRFLDLNSKRIGDDGVKALVQALKSSKTKIECLYLYNNNITDDGATVLIEWLICNNNSNSSSKPTRVAAPGESTLSSAVPLHNPSPCHKLQKVYLGKNKITDKSAFKFATLFQQQQEQSTGAAMPGEKLEVIDLSFNPISEACAKTIEDSAKQYSKSITSLYFIGND